MLFSCLAGFVLGISFLSLPPVLDSLMALYGISYAGISILLSGLLWSYAIMQIPAGLISDRIGIPRAMFISLVLVGGGNFLSAAVPSYELALAGRIVTGIGIGLAFITVMKLIALHAPKGRIGTFQAFASGSFFFGCIVDYLLLPCIARFSWRWTFLAPGLSALLLLWILPRLTFTPPSGAHQTFTSLGRILKTPSTWVIGFLHAVSWGAVIAFGNWLPSLLTEVWGGPSTVPFAWGGAVGMLVSGIGRWVGGFFLIRISPTLVVRLSIIFIAITLLVLSLVTGPLLVFCLVLAAIWFGSVVFGALFHLAAKATYSLSQGTLFGVINFLGNVGAILFTILFGLSKEVFGSFHLGLPLLAAFSFVGFFAFRSIRK